MIKIYKIIYKIYYIYLYIKHIQSSDSIGKEMIKDGFLLKFQVVLISVWDISLWESLFPKIKLKY